jgi:hypothetical protein
MRRYCPLPTAFCLPRNKKPLPDKKRLGQACVQRPLIFPARDNSVRGQELAPVRQSLDLRLTRLLWRHRAQPSATLDKKRYSVVEASILRIGVGESMATCQWSVGAADAFFANGGRWGIGVVELRAIRGAATQGRPKVVGFQAEVSHVRCF